MKTVILAGGFGTRLSEETQTIPKPMIEIGGKPLLWHIMKVFSSQGFNEFIIALGYKGEVIKKYFVDYIRLQADISVDFATNNIEIKNRCQENWKIDLVDTGLKTMTGGRLRRLKHLLPETFFFTYGDGLANIDLHKLLASHKKSAKIATVTAVSPPSRFGIINIDESSVTSFSEKPQLNNEWINGGYFLLEPQAIEYVGSDDISWEKAPCQQIASDGNMAAYKHHGFWQCVDTLHELRKLRGMWEEGQAPWKIW